MSEPNDDRQTKSRNIKKQTSKQGIRSNSIQSLRQIDSVCSPFDWNAPMAGPTP